jgi:competence protein ComEC
VVALAAAVSVAVASHSIPLALIAALIGALPFRSPRLVVLAALLVTLGAVRAEHAWSGLAPDRLGPYTGWVRLVSDPQPNASSTRLVVDVGGERFETWIRGRHRQLRIAELRGGQLVLVGGVRHALAHGRAGRVASQHVVGEFTVDWLSDVRDGSPLARASNRVRATIEVGAAALRHPYDTLFRGLVIGDDRDQPPEMIARFRASGLSHLTAVSGQNLAFLLAAFGPLLVRLRPWIRWSVTLALIGWFAALTRFEPSILRAAAMAAVSATAFATGRERSPVRGLALAVILLLLIDPLLAWSVGFWLSVGAAGGVCTVGPMLARRLAPHRGLGRLAPPLGITMGAQAGVAIPALLVFGHVPVVSIPANLLAVPVAGAVMLYGIPAALLAGFVPVCSGAVMFPAQVGCVWVDTVARLGSRLAPPPPWNAIGWLVVVAGTLVVVATASGRDNTADHHGDTPVDRR